MKIVHSDFSKGVVKLQIENLDDLWYLSTILDKSDLIEGETYRKIRIGDKDSSSEVVKKKVYLKIEAEKIEFSKHQNTLRINGTIIEGPEDISKGSYHTITVDEGTVLKIEKEKFLKYQIDKLKEASESFSSKILIVVFDREQAVFAKLKRQGYEVLTKIQGQVQKKNFEQSEKNFYVDIYKLIQEYDKREALNHIIIASPSFFKEYLLKEIKDEKIKKKTVTATCSSADESAITEVMKRQELKTVLSGERTAKELEIVEDLLEKISKEGMSVYGFNHTKQASDAGAVEKLLVSDDLILKKREDESFESLEKIMKAVDKGNGEVHILNSENEAGKKLDSLGGIAGILRYKIEF